MSRRRVIPWIVLVAVAAPLAFPFVALLREPAAWSAWSESGRLASLAGNTLTLAAGAVLIAVPIGTALAVALSRFRVGGATFLRVVLTLALFVPLPVFAVAWQIVLGSWLPNLALDPGQVAWRPWRLGLVPAAIVHGVAGVPWVFWIATILLGRTDRALEDAARIEGGTKAVLRFVLFPRLAGAMAAAAAWVAVQAVTEIPVTDAMMVRTFAEEVYTEMVGNPAGVSAAIAVTVPVWLLGCGVALFLSAKFRHRFPPPGESTEAPRLLNRSRPTLTAFAWLAAIVVAGLPLAALLGKASGGFRPGVLVSTLNTQLRDGGTVILESLLAATAAGCMAASLAWYSCVTLGRSRRGFTALIVCAVALWLAPGPVVGFGLKELIFRLLDLEDAVFAAIGIAPTFPPLRSLLYDQPSPLPAAWAAVVRFFPLAVAMILPAVRAVPTELWDEARLDGLGARKLLRQLLLPLTGPAAFRAAAAVAVLALGEVSASKLVNPPAQRTYILDLFNQMHYGAEATVAGLCLVQVAMTALLFSLFLGLQQRSSFPARAVS